MRTFTRSNTKKKRRPFTLINAFPTHRDNLWREQVVDHAVATRRPIRIVSHLKKKVVSEYNSVQQSKLSASALFPRLSRCSDSDRNL